MASTPKPTERQLRQHALDRALTDGVTGALLSMLIMSDPNGRCNPEQFSDAVTKVADKFVEYLRGPAEVDRSDEAIMGLFTAQEMVNEIIRRLRSSEYTEYADDLLEWAQAVPKALQDRPADH